MGHVPRVTQMAKPGFRLKAEHIQLPSFVPLRLRVRIVISCATQVKCLLLIVKYLFHYLVEEYRFPIFISDVDFSFRIKLI